MDNYTEGQTATHPDGRRIVFKGGQWVNLTGISAASYRRVKPTKDDMTALTAASSQAQAERDALRDYSAVAKSVDDFNTGPYRAAMLDAVLPNQDGGLWDKVGAALLSPFRPHIDDRTIAARDHLDTVNAKVALAGSQQMKGSSSDKDTALMRMAGIGPYKTRDENHRIIAKAREDSGLSQARAAVRAGWIARFGSIGNPSLNGMTFEEALGQTERNYAAAREKRREPHPAPPWTRRKATNTNGWSVKRIK